MLQILRQPVADHAASTALAPRPLRTGSGGARVELKSLAMRYGEQDAVKGIDLAVEPGEFVGLLGPSGSGKTTCLMMIAGFLKPTAGDVRIDDVSVIEAPPEQRNIGVVFQNYALFPHLSVAHNVSFPLEMRRTPRQAIAEKVERALASVGLEGMNNRYPHELSGGQQQRVALARALIFEPPLLLMDEPLGALDKALRKQMQLELRALHRNLGATILYVTHDQEEALALADRIAIFERGLISQIDVPTVLYRDPANAFVAGFLGDCNFIPLTAIARSDKTWQVRVGAYSGPVPPSRSAALPAEGGRLAVRPHQIRLGESPSRDWKGDGSGIAATVSDAIFLGEVVDYVLDLATGETIRARCVSDSVAAPHRAGDPVRVSWDWSQVRVV